MSTSTAAADLEARREDIRHWNEPAPEGESRGELVSRCQRFGAQAFADDFAEQLEQKHRLYRDRLEAIFATFEREAGSVAPFSEIMRVRFRAKAIEEIAQDVRALCRELGLRAPEALDRFHPIDLVPQPRRLHTRRSRFNGGTK